MICDHIDNIETYKGIDERVYSGLQLLRTQDFSNMAAGHHQIEGMDIYIVVLKHMSKKVEDAKLEAHREYVDIQYVHEGIDLMGYTRLTNDMQEIGSKPEKDSWFYDAPVDFVKLPPGQFAIMWPHDAHKPHVAVDDIPVHCTKIVVKVKIN